MLVLMWGSSSKVLGILNYCWLAKKIEFLLSTGKIRSYQAASKYCNTTCAQRSASQPYSTSVFCISSEWCVEMILDTYGTQKIILLNSFSGHFYKKKTIYLTMSLPFIKYIFLGRKYSVNLKLCSHHKCPLSVYSRRTS